MLSQHFKTQLKTAIIIIPISLFIASTFTKAETFTCEIALADYGELGAMLYTTKSTDPKHNTLLAEQKPLIKSIQNNADCNATFVRGSYVK